MIGSRLPQIVLVVGFLVILFGVPIHQIVVEIRGQQPVQFTDLFHHPPTVKNLRAFEQAIEDNWWGQRVVRLWMQRFLYLTLRDTGAKAVEGREGWMFYRPGLQYLTEAARTEVERRDSVWALPSTGHTRQDSVVRRIVGYRDQLKRRGIELLVVPIPSKASVYPDRLTRRFDGRPDKFRSPTEALLQRLTDNGVATVDLFVAFREARSTAPLMQSGKAYFLAHDTHWTPAGARVAARAVATRLRAMGHAAEQPWNYETQDVRVTRRGDVPEMMQMPNAREFFPSQDVSCVQVRDAIAGLLIPPIGGREGRFKNDHLLDTPMESSILLLGDSFSRIYQFAEPASLGEVADASQQESVDRERKRLLPGSAGFPSLLARELSAPIDYIVSDGGAATDVRRRLSVDAEILENKNVVIWEFTERDIRLGANGWLNAPLPSGL